MAISFRKATDELMAPISHEELAKALGRSVPAIRQARLDEGAKAFRNPPNGWEPIVAKIALQRGNRLLRLAIDLKEQSAHQGGLERSLADLSDRKPQTCNRRSAADR